MTKKYEIKQIDSVHGGGYAFSGFDFAKAHGLRVDDYRTVYEGEVQTISSETDDALLKRIFRMFCDDLPDDFNGWPISVSDLIVLDGRAYYCDLHGFKAV